VAKNKTRRGRDVYIVAFRGSASRTQVKTFIIERILHLRS
jgi:hypothetical protein